MHKKNSLGFTLIELLATIFIISLVFGISFYYVTNVINTSKDKSNDLSVTNIKRVANLYTKEYSEEVIWSKNGENSTTCVTLNDLVNSGYLKQKQANEVEWNSIIITKNSNNVILSEEIDTTGVCGTLIKKVPIPKGNNNCNQLVYNGSNQILANTSSGDYYFDTSSNSKKDAGEYKVIAKLKDSSSSVWKDNTVTDKTITCYIKKAIPVLTVNPSGDVGNVNGIKNVTISSNVAGILSVKSTNTSHVIGSIDNKNITANGTNILKVETLSSRDTTTYVNVTITPNDIKNYYTATSTYTVSNIEKIKVNKPTSSLCRDVTYNRSQQDLVATPSSNAGYIYLNSKATNAGTYTVAAKLKYGYIWTDGTSDIVEFNCSIKKKLPEFRVISVVGNPSGDSNIFSGNIASGTLMKGYSAIITLRGEVAGGVRVINSDTTNASTTNPNNTTTDNGTFDVTVSAINVTNKAITISFTFTPTDILNYYTVTTNYVINQIKTNQFTLTYNSNGGSACSPSTKSGLYGQKWGDLCNPTRTGYTFLGWYNTAETSGGTQITKDSIVSGNITVYGRWSINKIYIRYHVNGGSWGGSTDTHLGVASSFVTYNNNSTTAFAYNYNTSINLADWNNPNYININRTGFSVKAGYEWCTNANGTGNCYNHSTNYANGGTDATAATHFCDARVSSCTVILYVNWVASYNVTYNSGNLISGLYNYDAIDDTRAIWTQNNSTVTVTSKVNDGYAWTFIRVYLIANTEYIFNCSVNGGTFGSANNNADTTQVFISLNENNGAIPLAGNSNYKFSVPTTGHYSLRFDVNKKDVTHTFSNISITRNIQTIATVNNTNYILPANPSKPGHTFLGWYTGLNGTGTNITASTKMNSTSNHTLYAHWAVNTVTINYNGNGGTWNSNKSSDYKVNGSNTVIRKTNSAVYTQTYSYDYVIGHEKGLPNYNNKNIFYWEMTGYIARSGYEWCTEASGATDDECFSQSYNRYRAQNIANSVEGCNLNVATCPNVITLYVNWLVSAYSISYNLDSGSFGKKHPTTVNFVSVARINNPTKSIKVNFTNNVGATIDYGGSSVSKSGGSVSYSFTGWTATGLENTAKTGTTNNPTTTWKGAATTNQYFKSLKKSGTVSMTAHWGVPTITLPKVTKKGYTCHWESLNSGGGTMTKASGATYTPATSGGATERTFTAVCSVNVCTIKWNNNGGEWKSNFKTSDLTLDYTHGPITNMRNCDATRSGYSLVSGAQWINPDVKKTYSHSQGSNYSVKDFCPDIETKNQTVTLYANWYRYIYRTCGTYNTCVDSSCPVESYVSGSVSCHCSSSCTMWRCPSNSVTNSSYNLVNQQCPASAPQCVSSSTSCQSCPTYGTRAGSCPTPNCGCQSWNDWGTSSCTVSSNVCERDTQYVTAQP